MPQPGSEDKYTGKRTDAKRPLITRKAPAEILLAKHESPNSFPHAAPEGNAGVGEYSTSAAFSVPLAELESNY